MSEETTTEMSEDNDFAKMKKAHAAEIAGLRAQLDEFKPAAINETVRAVGLDPNTGNGLVLKDLLGDSADVDKAQELVAKYGWEPEPAKPAVELSPAERVMQDSGQRLASLASVTTSDTPPDVNQQIAEAYADGNTKLARSLKNDLLANLARQAG